MKRQASCACGQLAIVCDGDVAGSSICHCFACQQRTGSVFGVQVRYAKDQVTIQGNVTTYERTGDSGGRASMSFCPTCGSTVFWEVDGMPESIIVAVGAFADPEFPAPTFSVYEARMHPWVALPESVVTHWD